MFDEKAVKKLRQYVTSDEEAAAILTAPYVLKRGIAVSGHRNHKGKGHPSVTFAGKVTINGTEGVVGACVLYGDKNRIHSLRILAPNGSEFELIKNDTEMANSGSTYKGVESPTKSASNNIISQIDPKSQEKNSEREGISNRQLLAEAFESTVQNDIEKISLPSTRAR